MSRSYRQRVCVHSHARIKYQRLAQFAACHNERGITLLHNERGITLLPLRTSVLSMYGMCFEKQNVCRTPKNVKDDFFVLRCCSSERRECFAFATDLLLTRSEVDFLFFLLFLHYVSPMSAPLSIFVQHTCCSETCVRTRNVCGCSTLPFETTQTQKKKHKNKNVHEIRVLHQIVFHHC
ncbi:Hypothetical protein, putative [Bodo saltans]|uniref:Uncharacterized protein n=1 Tax=Bodo saltans TaxID=75058 RepID=A0A0S4IJY0_BODSA|nr:Hypothetical protein, putative [Bodo saltans]|eukprot:CUE97587.1 Hypothetical protein, putative [Bodo saltans]